MKQSARGDPAGARRTTPVTDFVIGVDGGGTRTRALILDLDGRERGEAEGEAGLVDPQDPAAAAEAIAGTVARVAAAAGVALPATALCAGLAGAGREGARRAVEDRLQPRSLARTVLVVTDAEAAFFDAFEDGPGILVIAGTGSVAWGRGLSGAMARAGGWGALVGDEGSGHDVGRRALRAAARAADGRGPDTALLDAILRHLELDAPDDLIPWGARAAKAEIAALAPLVCEVAAGADPAATRIVEDALHHLDDHVAALLERLGPWTDPPPVAATGGLIEPGAPLHDALLRTIRRHRCTLRQGPIRAARGAARLALRAALSGSAG